jgi:isoleucyl-tRNA synthetase
MDWGNDYYTFSDTNIEYIWRFLKVVHERGWLYVGHRSTEWCPRCGTSISAHELTGSYVDRADPSLKVRLPLLDRPGEALVIWTTTPWTLPANVAAAVNPDLTYGRRSAGEWVAVGPDDDPAGFEQTLPGSGLVGWRYEGPFDELTPGSGVEHRVIDWKDVALDEGTGIVHIAPGCGHEDFELSRVHHLPVLQPVDEAGRYYDDYGWLHGLSTTDANEQIIGVLEERGRVVEAGLYEHRYPECWRCHTPLIFRIADDWFIGVEEIREPMRRANADVDWTPDYFEKRMDDWLVNMGDWNISRRRYYGLPLPFYPCSCGHLNVIGSREELEERATAGLDELQELHRPWIDAVTVRCSSCGADDVARIEEVGDVWLDAGIVPLSTLGWENASAVEGGYGRGAAAGLTGADLPDHSYWETWFPADLVSEMREQIRLWFYSQLFMSVALVGRAPFKSVLGYEKMLAEDGREMHGSWGNMIDAEEAFERMGADVMRWQFCAQPPDRNLLFGYGPAHEIKRKLLTLWNSIRFFVDYANIEGFEPLLADLDGAPDCSLEPLDRWLAERSAQLVADCTAALDARLTHLVMRAFESYVDDLSNWYIRRSRRRFYSYDESAFRSLWAALVQALRVIAPVMPFLSDFLWRRLVSDAVDGAPSSVHLAGWPAPREPDRALLDSVAEVRRVVELGRAARASASLKLRQPIRRLVVQGARGASDYGDEIAEELRVKDVTFGRVEALELRVKPNLPVLGPRLGRELGAVRAALAEGRFEALDGGGFRVNGLELGADDVLVERTAQEGWALAESDGLTVAIDTALDDELAREGRLLDLIHAVNSMRRDAGLDIQDRIRLVLPRSMEELTPFLERLADEVLAVSVAFDDVDEPQIKRA